MRILLQSIILTIFLGINLNSYAQNYLKIFDAQTLEPLIFANVKLTEVNTHNIVQTASDEYGEIEIPFNNETIIEISYIGYEKLRRQIKPGRIGILYVFATETEVQEVVVTGNPKEISVKESMYKVNVIDKEEIEKKAAVSLADVLMNELNIQISKDGVLGSQMSLQGLGGNNIKIMIDGVPVIGRLDGNLDLSQINMNNIERIEIVEGPLSAIYGSNAIAGVINLISKQSQKDKVEAYVNTLYESIGTYNIDALVGFKVKKHLIQFSGGRYFFDGWNPTEYDRDLQWNPKEQYFGGINYVYRSKNDWFHKVKGNYFQDKIENRYNPDGSLPEAFDDYYYTKRIDGTYSINGKINDNLSFNSNNAYNYYNRIKNKYRKDLSTLESTLVLDSDGEDNQDTTMANQWMTRTFISYDNEEKRFSFQTGVDLNIENGQGGRFKDEDGSAAIIADLAAFMSTNIKINEKINLQPALRYGYNSQFKSVPTPSFLMKYNINDKTTFRFNYGMGFRAPSLKEIYLVFNDANHNIFGNKDLVPEQSQNLSASLKYENKKNLHNYQLEPKIFYTYKYNAIVLTPDDNNIYQYVNIEDLTSMGAQVNAKYNWKNLSFNYGFSYIGISNNSYTSNNELNKFFFYPQMQTNISYNFIKAKLNISLFNKWNGARQDYRLDENSTAQQVKIQAYDLLDFTVQKSFWNNKIKINAGIRNLLNVTNINSSTSGAAHSSSEGSQIASGRTYFIGLKFGTRN